MRARVGAGYGVTFEQRGDAVLLLCGGDKPWQQRYVERAKLMVAERRG